MIGLNLAYNHVKSEVLNSYSGQLKGILCLFSAPKLCLLDKKTKMRRFIQHYSGQKYVRSPKLRMTACQSGISDFGQNSDGMPYCVRNFYQSEKF